MTVLVVLCSHSRSRFRRLLPPCRSGFGTERSWNDHRLQRQTALQGWSLRQRGTVVCNVPTRRWSSSVTDRQQAKSATTSTGELCNILSSQGLHHWGWTITVFTDRPTIQGTMDQSIIRVLVPKPDQ